MTVTYDAREVELYYGSGPKQKLVTVRFKEAVDAAAARVKEVTEKLVNVSVASGEVVLSLEEFVKLRSHLLGDVGQEVMVDRYTEAELERAALATAKALDEACAE